MGELGLHRLTLLAFPNDTVLTNSSSTTAADSAKLITFTRSSIPLDGSNAEMTRLRISLDISCSSASKEFTSHE